MSKFNIGHISGITVNGAEKLVDLTKKEVPAAKNATKGKVRGWKDSVKAEYNKVRQGEVDSPISEPINVQVFELTTGGK